MMGGIGVDLGTGAVERLLERTEGWGAGLYLAGLSLRDRPDPGDFLETFGGDHRQIVDYLGEEALSGLDADLRDYLVRTSAFERFCAPLTDAALGREDGERLLAALERSNLFLVPLDERRRWYRYHHLFRDLLAAEREREVPEDEVAELHRRAGWWFAEQGLVDEALRHLVAGGATEDASELVARNWGHMRREGWLVDADRWLSMLPDTVREADVRLCLAGAWIAISLGRVEVAERWIAAADAAGDVSDPASGAASCESARVSAAGYVAMFRGDPASAEALTRRAVELETGTAEWRAVALMGHAFALQALLRVAEAERMFGEVVEMTADSAWTIPALISLSAMAECRITTGDVDGAAELAARAIELAESERHAEFPHGGQAHLVMGRVLIERGEHDRGLAMTERGIELVERGSAPSPRAGAHLQRALAAARAGDAEVARAGLARAEALMAGLGRAPGWFEDVRGQVEDELARITPRRARPERGDELSDRERAVLRLLTGDGSLREIADSIFVSHNTIKTQVRSIYRKLGVSDRAEAVSRGRELGII
jgi:LuxR family maltose regulon positive regulatory protein